MTTSSASPGIAGQRRSTQGRWSADTLALTEQRHALSCGGRAPRSRSSPNKESTVSGSNPCFSNVPVDVQIEWARAQATIAFGEWEIIAFPPSQDHDPSLHIELTRTRLSAVEGGSVLNELLSVAAWLDDNFAVLLPGWTGNPVPCRPRRRTTGWPRSIVDTWWQCLRETRRANASRRAFISVQTPVLRLQPLPAVSARISAAGASRRSPPSPSRRPWRRRALRPSAYGRAAVQMRRCKPFHNWEARACR
jgi:hypothetical protein